MAVQWGLPRLRVDVNGDWFDDDVEVTHPGILLNLRGNLRRDAQGYFIQTRVRIPVEVADVPFVVIRFERGAGGFIASLRRSSVPVHARTSGRGTARYTTPAAIRPTATFLGVIDS